MHLNMSSAKLGAILSMGRWVNTSLDKNMSTNHIHILNYLIPNFRLGQEVDFNGSEGTVIHEKTIWAWKRERQTADPVAVMMLLMMQLKDTTVIMQ